MTPEQRKRSIDFIIRTLANLTIQHEKFEAGSQKLSAQIAELRKACRDLVEVSRRHSRRLND